MSQYRRNYESVLIDERNTFNRFARFPMSGLTSRVVLYILLSRSLNICSGRSNGNVGGQAGDAISSGEWWHKNIARISQSWAKDFARIVDGATGMW